MLSSFACTRREALPPAYLRVGPALVVIENDTLPIEAPIDAWIYPEGKFLTVAEVGQRVPIVPHTTHPVLLAGGVRVNGITVSRKPYPFWQFDTLSGPFSAEEEQAYTPLYRYFPDTLLEYLLREDFESPQLGLRIANAGENGAVQIQRTFEAPRRGVWAGRIDLPANSDFRAESTTPFTVPQQEVWAEISVRGTRNLGVGLTVEDRQTGRLVERSIYLLLRPPDTGWGTFYVDVTPWLAGKGTLFRYRLYLTSAGDTTGSHVLYLDDVRLLTLRRS